MPGHPMSEPDRGFRWPPDDDDLTNGIAWPPPEPPAAAPPQPGRYEDLLWADPDYVHPLAHELPLVVTESPVAGPPPVVPRPPPEAPASAGRGMGLALPAACLGLACWLGWFGC